MATGKPTNPKMDGKKEGLPSGESQGGARGPETGNRIPLSYKIAMTKFKEYAINKGYIYKVYGDDAYSTKPMGMGKYIKIISAKGEIIIYEEGIGRYSIGR